MELYEAINAVMDQKAFFERINKIVVYPDFRLEFVFQDGSITITSYRERSRRESWTPEMRKAAKERTERRAANA